MKRVRIGSYVYPASLVGVAVAFFIFQARLGQYRTAVFWACFVVAAALLLLCVRRLIVEVEMGPWRKKAAGIDPEKLDRSTGEGQRQWLVWLYAREDYDAAAEYAATLPDEVLMSAPCESLADKVRRRKPEAARRLYRAAIEAYRRDGRNATGSGEGLMAMDGVARLEKKMGKVKG